MIKFFSKYLFSFILTDINVVLPAISLQRNYNNEVLLL